MFDMIYTGPLRWFTRISISATVALLMASSLQAQPAAFQKAKEAYQMHNYDEATELFSEVGRDTSVEKEVRRTALQYLGHIHVARNEREKAREALEQLLSLEPPPVELDPDRQPLPLMRLYYQVRKQQKGGYCVHQDDDCKGGPGLQTMAIMDFNNNSIYQREQYDPLSNGFPSMMINYLNEATDLKVIERQRIQWLLDELKLQRKAGVVDQKTAVRAGKLLGATTVLFGSYLVRGEDEMRIDARLVKVETGEILLSRKVSGEPDEFVKLVEGLSRDLASAINVKTQDTDIRESGGTSVLDAMMAHAKGVRELEKGNYQAARKHFEQALEYDPNYSQAQDKLESLEVMLASREENTTGSSDEGGGSQDTLEQ